MMSKATEKSIDTNNIEVKVTRLKDHPGENVTGNNTNFFPSNP